MNQNKAAFVGFITDQQLRTYYQASDFYIQTSPAEGGPVAVMQAFACGIPVICTRTGNTAELMDQQKCGVLLDIEDYAMWRVTLDDVMADRKVVMPVDRTIAMKYYSWPIVAKKFVDIYTRVRDKYYA